MFDLIDNISKVVPMYMLVFARISALMLALPIFSYGQISPTIRVLLSFVLTLMIAPLVSESFAIVITSTLQLVIYIIREVFIGLILGFGAQLVLEGFSIAGSYIGMQMGMAIMNVFDPVHSQNQPIVSNFWIMIVMMFMLVTNSHYFLIETVFQNFKLIEPGGALLRSGVGRTIVDGGKMMFETGLKFAAPSLIFLLSVDIAISFMARVMPQLNIFFVSLPLKLGVGILMLIVSLRIFQGLFSFIMREMEVFVTTLVRAV